MHSIADIQTILETGAHRWCASLSWSSGYRVIVLVQAMFGGGNGIQWTWRGGLMNRGCGL